MEHEIWFTAILNKLLSGPVTALLTGLGHGLAPADPAHPIPNYIAMEVLVILIILTVAALVRRRLSLEAPGKLQQAMEVVVEFVQGMTDEIIGHEGRRYLPMLGTLFLFIAICNLAGLIPTLQTPTAQIQVTLGSAVAAFIYYNIHGLRQRGAFGFFKHLWGPIWWVGFLMFPIEVVSNFGRLLSLSVRLYANMLVGGILEKVFGGMVPILLPVIFMALHIFVSLLQAYIFMLLPAIYISMAVSEEH